jgi:hypothetical protein
MGRRGRHLSHKSFPTNRIGAELRPHRRFSRQPQKVRDFCHLQRPPHPLSRLAGHRSWTSTVGMSRAAEAAIAASYKSLKEDFVSNLTGGEIGEINYVTAVAPVRYSFPSAGLC